MRTSPRRSEIRRWWCSSPHFTPTHPPPSPPQRLNVTTHMAATTFSPITTPQLHRPPFGLATPLSLCIVRHRPRTTHGWHGRAHHSQNTPSSSRITAAASRKLRVGYRAVYPAGKRDRIMVTGPEAMAPFRAPAGVTRGGRFLLETRLFSGDRWMCEPTDASLRI